MAFSTALSKRSIFVSTVACSGSLCLIIFLLIKIFSITGIKSEILPILLIIFSVVLHFGLLSWFFVTRLSSDQALLFQIANQIKDIIFVKDSEGKFVYCNNALAKLYSTTSDAIVGKDDFHFTNDKKLSDEYRNSVRQVISSGQTQEVYESALDRNSGHIRYFHSIKVPFTNYSQNKHVLVLATDITEVVQLKNESENDKRSLQAVLDVSQEGLWEWNTKTNEVKHNNRWNQITGIVNSKNTFAEFESCILEKDKPRVLEALDNLVNKGVSYSIEFRMIRPDGKHIWIWDRGKAVEHDEQGNALWLVGIMLDITERKLAEEEVHRLAYSDALTGLKNRSALENILMSEQWKSKQSEQYHAFFFLDLDRFKLLNDGYGHRLGDSMLCEVGKRMLEFEDEFYVVSRFGGDEFLLLATDVADTASQARTISEDLGHRLLNKISKTAKLESPNTNTCVSYEITASIGIVLFNNTKENLDSLFQLADIALYRAKEAGRNTLEILSASDDNVLTHQRFHTEIQRGLERNEFIGYLQPQYNSNREIVGAELLARWLHPKHGVLSPFHFISVAEEFNFISNIGEVMLRQACLLLVEWQCNASTKHMSISVNISAQQIWQSDFVSSILDIVNASGIDHTKLVLEVTESAFIQDVKDATDKLLKIKETGIRVSLDDFGTGFSSLSYLRDLPIDELKIDRTFIKNLRSNIQSKQLIQAIQSIAKVFNLEIIAEGVETEDDLRELKEIGIEFFQGYLFSKPIPSIDALIENYNYSPKQQSNKMGNCVHQTY